METVGKYEAQHVNSEMRSHFRIISYFDIHFIAVIAVVSKSCFLKGERTGQRGNPLYAGIWTRTLKKRERERHSPPCSSSKAVTDMVLAHQPAVPAPSSVRDGNKVVFTPILPKWDSQTWKLQSQIAPPISNTLCTVKMLAADTRLSTWFVCLASWH